MPSSGLLYSLNIIANIYVLAYAVAVGSFSLCKVILHEYNTLFFQIPIDRYIFYFPLLLIGTYFLMECNCLRPGVMGFAGTPLT